MAMIYPGIRFPCCASVEKLRMLTSESSSPEQIITMLVIRHARHWIAACLSAGISGFLLSFLYTTNATSVEMNSRNRLPKSTYCVTLPPITAEMPVVVELKTLQSVRQDLRR